MITLRTQKRSDIGFTLIEMVVVIIILSIIGGLGALIIRGGLRSYFTQRDISGADAQAQVALARMTRELRVIRTATAADLTESPSSVTFVDSGGRTIQYQYNAAAKTLTRSENTGSAQILADHVSAAAFTYWQSNATTAATGPSDTYYLTVQLTITQGVSALTYRATIHPRGFV